MHVPMHVHVGCVGSFGFVVSVLFFLDFLESPSPNAMKSIEIRPFADDMLLLMNKYVW